MINFLRELAIPTSLAVHSDTLLSTSLRRPAFSFTSNKNVNE